MTFSQRNMTDVIGTVFPPNKKIRISPKRDMRILYSFRPISAQRHLVKLLYRAQTLMYGRTSSFQMIAFEVGT